MAYSTGSITLTNGQKSFSGTGTAWNSVGLIRPGYVLEIPGGKHFRIEAISSDTAGTLEFAYEGSTGTFSSYAMFSVSEVKALQAAQIAALIDKIDGGVDEALAGKFPDGTFDQPGMRFTADEDNGFRRTGANTWQAVAGGQGVVNFGTGGLGGPAFMADGTNPAAGKIATPGFANLLLDDADARTILQATGSDFFNALRLSGFFRFTSASTGGPLGVDEGMVLHLIRLSGNGAGHHFQLSFGNEGQLHRRWMTNSSGDWTLWSQLAFEGADVDFADLTSTSVAIDGAMQWGTKLTVAAQAVATITPPFKGGWLMMGVNSGTDSAPASESFFGYVDIGTSLNQTTVSKGANLTILTSNQDLSTTSGADGVLTLSLRSNGTMQIQNRMVGSRAIDFHFNGAT